MPSYFQDRETRFSRHNSDKARIAKASSKLVESDKSDKSAMDHIKRPTLAAFAKKGSDKKEKEKEKERSLSKDKKASEKRASAPPKPVSMTMYMESPPALFIGSPQTSSGALISGRLQVTPRVDEATLETIVMYLECTTTTKRPVQDRCRECMANITDLYEWTFLSKPKLFNAQDGMQELPFSHLIPGHLPPTTHGQIGSIDYSLHVRAIARGGQEIEFRRELILQRALMPGPEKNSIRIFPPTELTLHVTLPNIVYPIGEFPVHCRMTNITSRIPAGQTRWRLRKLTWRIEEHETMISPACPTHAPKVGGEGKTVQQEHSREVERDELKSGWKTDFDADAGTGAVEGEFMATVGPSSKIQCSVTATEGFKIVHNLVLEMVIAEEWASAKRPASATPTGVARVLRTQFALNVTDRAGMGLSWDDEQPPMYEDVPASPPHYRNEGTRILVYDGEDLNQDVEGLSLG